VLRLATSCTPKLLPSSVATNYEPKLYRLQPDRVQAELWANSQWCNFCWQSLQLWTATVVFGVLLASGRLRTAIAGTVTQSNGSCFPTNQPNPRCRVRLEIQRVQSSASPETSHILWNPKVHCHIHKSPFETSHPIVCL
jgi:hypothetical protein